jgi:hypothetical protein
MSYTLGLLIEPAPPDDETAFEQFDALVDASGSDEQPHPTFVAVHAELTARFPCRSELPDDQIDDGVWSDWPLINNFGEREAVIGLVYSAVETVRPFVIEVANKHGVTVFDWQTGTIHRPGDFVPTMEGEGGVKSKKRAESLSGRKAGRRWQFSFFQWAKELLRLRREPANTGQPQSPPTADHAERDG